MGFKYLLIFIAFFNGSSLNGNSKITAEEILPNYISSIEAGNRCNEHVQITLNLFYLVFFGKYFLKTEEVIE